MDGVTSFWLILGVILMLAEMVIPGGIVIFVGISAALVGLLRSLGIIESHYASLLTFFVGSIGLWLSLSGMVLKLTGGGDTSVGDTDEDEAAFDSVVEVVKTISEDHTHGRIRFQGSTWAARSAAGDIPSGEWARIILRDNLVWVVEPAAPPLLEDPLEES